MEAEKNPRDNKPEIDPNQQKNLAEGEEFGNSQDQAMDDDLFERHNDNMYFTRKPQNTAALHSIYVLQM